MESAESILADLPGFAEGVLSELESLGISDIRRREMDHACFRVRTLAEFEKARQAFGQVGKIISEAIIGGRPIVTVLLNDPVPVGAARVPCIEIPAPKTGQDYLTGWEHCEFVISESFANFVQGREALSWDWGGASKSYNAELALRLSYGRSAKFHHQSLLEVIRREEQTQSGQ
jgi:predicted metalloenzyme YecM